MSQTRGLASIVKISAAAIPVVMAAGAGSATATVIDWKPPVAGSGGSIVWTLGTNWDGGVAPANDITTDVARFNQTSYNFQPTLTTASITGIVIGDGSTVAGATTITGTSLTLGASGVTLNAGPAAASVMNLQSGIILGANQTWTNNSAATLTKNLTSNTGLVLDTNARQLTFNGTGNFVIRNAITGTGSLVKNGTGQLTIGRVGANSFNGGVTINAGVLQANADNATNALSALGTGTVTLGDTTLGNSNAATLSLNNAGGGGGNNLTSNALTVAAGSSGKLLMHGAALTQSYTGPITLNNNLSLSSVAGTTLQLFGGSISGAGDLIVDAGTVNLDGGSGTGNAGFTGNIRVKAGTFKLANANMVEWGSTVNRPVVNANNTIAVASGATFDWSNNKIAYGGLADQDGGGGTVTTSASAASGIVPMNISGSGTYGFSGLVTDTATKAPLAFTVALTGSGAQTLSNVANAYTGPTSLYSGTLAVTKLANGGAVSSIGSSTSDTGNLIFNGGALKYTGAGDTTDRRFTVASGGGTIDASGATAVNFTNTAAAAVTDAVHTGTLTNGSNVISAVGGSTGLLFLFDLVPGQAVYTGSATSWTSIGTVTSVDRTAKTITLDTSYVGAGGSLQGLAFVADRTLVLTGSNTDSNTLAAALSDSTSNTALVTVPNGELGVTKNGNGKWVLSGTNTNSGATTVNAGTLLIDGTMTSSAFVVNGGTLGGNGETGAVTVNSTGVVAPGSSIGMLTTGNATFGNGSLYAAEIGASSSADLLAVGGALDLSSSLDALDLQGVVGSFDGATKTIASYTTLSGVFNLVTLNGAPLIGTPANFLVNGYNYSVDYGTGSNSSITLAVVPEPAMLSLLGLGVFGLVSRRTRRSA